MTYFLISFLALIISLKAFAQNLTFEEYWIQVKNNNPLLKESESKIKVIENSPSILIPAPEISVSQMNEKVPFSSSGKMQRTFEISQSIPYFSKFSKASELRDSNFQKSISERSLLEKKLKQEAFEVFLSYTKNIELKKILLSKISFYQDHLARAKSLLVTSQVYQIHLYDIGIELSTIKSDIKRIEIDLKENMVILNRLTNFSIDNFTTPEVGALYEPTKFSVDSIEDHPSLLLLQSEIESMKKEKEMAKLDWAPDFSIKFKNYKSYDLKYTDGKELMVGITLPFIFPWQRNGIIESIDSKILAQHHRSEQTKAELKQDFFSLETKVKEVWELLSIYKDQSLPIIQKKMNLVHKITTLDMESLEAHKSAIDQLFNMQTKIIEEEMNYRLITFKLREITDRSKGLK